MISTLRVEVLAHHRQRVLELDEAAQREVLGLHRHDHARRRDERVDRQQPERRRRVDQDVVVVVLDRRERLLERALAADLARQRHVGAGEVDRRDGDVDLARLDHLGRSAAGARARRTSSVSIVSGFRPCDIVRFPCGSRSMQQHLAAPARRSATPRFSVVVVLATPPFWFASAITCVSRRQRHARRANVGTRKEARETHVQRHFGLAQPHSFRLLAKFRRGRSRPARRPSALAQRLGLRTSARSSPSSSPSAPARPERLDSLEPGEHARRHTALLVHAPTVAGRV